MNRRDRDIDAPTAQRVLATLEDMQLRLMVIKREENDFQTQLGVAQVEKDLAEWIQRTRRALRRCYPARSGAGRSPANKGHGWPALDLAGGPGCETLPATSEEATTPENRFSAPNEGKNFQ